MGKEKITSQKGSRTIPFIVGLFAGVVLAGVILWLSMPGMMLVVHESRYDSVDETCTQLKTAIEANGWKSPGITNMNHTMSMHGVQMDRKVRIVNLCNAKYAKDVLTTNPEVSTLMPCAWGVYEGNNGKIYISGMNMGLMGKMFGGNIAKVMGGSVSRDEKQMLKDVVQQ
ncbi:MAG: DUF302 domain-containing protein [Thermodesulfobacteriota bacterium]|nr:DUF302 domain-containing protein [Thermodesulfobacteriota bacterium]